MAAGTGQQAGERLSLQHQASVGLVSSSVAGYVANIALGADPAAISTWYLSAAQGILSKISSGYATNRQSSLTYLQRHAAVNRASVVPVPGSLDVSALAKRLEIVGPIGFKSAIAAGQDTDTALRHMATQMSGVADEVSRNGDRDVITRTAQFGRGVVGWRRHLSGHACGFCAMLASRGSVYISRRSAVVPKQSDAYHPHCHCWAEPLYERQQEPAYVRDLQSQWRRVTAGKSGREAQVAWRQHWEQRATPAARVRYSIPSPSGAGGAFERSAVSVRPLLAAAQSPADVSRVLEDEYQRITSRQMSADFRGSVQTAREHAEGLLQAVERYPDLRIDIARTGPQRGYAKAFAAQREIVFGQGFSSVANRETYLQRLAEDERTGFHVRGSLTPVGTALHEAGHLLDLATLGQGARADIEALLIRRGGGVIDDALIRREISEYATQNRDELIAEAFEDVMVNGAGASQLSREIVDIVDDTYRRTRRPGLGGTAVPRAPLRGLEEVPVPPAAGAAGVGAGTARTLSDLPRVENPEDMLAQAMGTNPRYGQAYLGELPPGTIGPVSYSQNCTRVVIGYEMRRRGFEVTAGATTAIGDTTAAYVRTFRLDGRYATRVAEDLSRNMTVREIAAEVETWPMGARGIVTVQGHTLNVERDIVTGRAVFIDAQAASKKNPIMNVTGFQRRMASRGAPADRMAVARVDDLELSDYGMRYVESPELNLSDGFLGKTQYPLMPGTELQPRSFADLAKIKPDDTYLGGATLRGPPRTVAQLRAAVSEHGVTVPAGLNKPALERLVADLERGVAPATARQSAVEAAGRAPAKVAKKAAAEPRNAPRVTALEFGAPAPHNEFGLPVGMEIPRSARRLSADQDRRLRLLLEADNSKYNRYLGWRERGLSHTDAVLRVDMPTLAQLERKLGAGTSLRLPPVKKAAPMKVAVPKPPPVPARMTIPALRTELQPIIDAAPDISRFELAGVPKPTLAHWVERVRALPESERPLEVARWQQVIADKRRALVDTLIEADELVANGASTRALTARAAARLRSAEQAMQGWPELAEIRKVTAAMQTGDPVKIRRAIKASGKKLGLAQIGADAGQAARFERGTMSSLGGKAIPDGAHVVVVRPGYSVEMGGRRIVMSRPVVREATGAEVGLPSRDVPTIGDILASAKTGNTARATAEDQITQAFEGDYGGLRVQVRRTQITGPDVEIVGVILDPSGRVEIGRFTRYLHQNPTTGEIRAEHYLLKIDPKYQGSGFAERFNDNLFDWYRRSGIKTVEMQANIDVGGYAWASRGWEFSSTRIAQEYIESVSDKVDQALATLRRTGRAPRGLTGEQLQQLALYVDDLRSGRRTIRAYDLSQFGRQPGQGGKTAMWAGKWLMLKTGWPAVLRIA